MRSEFHPIMFKQLNNMWIIFSPKMKQLDMIGVCFILACRIRACLAKKLTLKIIILKIALAIFFLTLITNSLPLARCLLPKENIVSTALPCVLDFFLFLKRSG